MHVSGTSARRIATGGGVAAVLAAAAIVAPGAGAAGHRTSGDHSLALTGSRAFSYGNPPPSSE
jgi:hypothetical protein